MQKFDAWQTHTWCLSRHKAALPEDGNLLSTLRCAYSNVIGAEMSTNASGFVSMTRGPGFTPSEDLLLARAWVSVSSNETDQDASHFWQIVTSIFNDAASDTQTPSPKRTPQSVLCRWTLVQRVAQKYIAARMTVLNTIPSGTNPGADEIREDAGIPDVVI
jgi:hypothetical protein